jgi:flagellar protein FliS
VGEELVVYNDRQQALHKYRQNQISTATPGKLVLMVYDGILSCLANARKELTDDGSMDVVHNELVKAQRLLQELQLGVDASVEEIGPTLESLYDALMEELVQANLQKDVESLDELAEQFAELREAWGQVVVDAASDDSSDSGPVQG